MYICMYVHMHMYVCMYVCMYSPVTYVLPMSCLFLRDRRANNGVTKHGHMLVGTLETQVERERERERDDNVVEWRPKGHVFISCLLQ